MKKCGKLFFATALVLVIILILGACGDTAANISTTEAPQTTEDSGTPGELTMATILGEGEKRFDFTVTDGDSNTQSFEIRTDKETVGEALMEVGLIEGEDSQFGIYVKKVNGIVADYNETKTYWAFYVNGEYASTGAESTKIDEAAHYEFKVEK